MFGTAVGFAALGPMGVVASTALSLFDAFLLEKLVEGWKPNRFVDRHLRDFLRKRGP
jgi:hypothetical protein